MKLRTSLRARHLTLLAVLGLTPLACGDATPGTDEFPCTSSEPEEVMGQQTGYETCSEGMRHRPEAVTCASELPRSATCESPDPENFPGACTSDADCTDQPHGQCGIFGQIPECTCRYGCVTDADCGDGQICDCRAPVGQCVRADCAVDADCPGDALCVAYVSDPGCGGTAFTCQTEADQCGSDADCTDGENCTQIDDHLECQMQACAIGRPFLVAGAHRTAEIAERADWLCGGIAPSVDGLSAELRDTLAAHWREVGLMEHASVAAFARFAMQLLAQGAPPDLVLAAQDAMRDETHHARLAFAFASAYAGRDIGPGPLAIDGALDDQSPRDILRMVIREGCIGETAAAIEAAEAAEHAADPLVKHTLARIADDEQRHAELAWRYVAWAVSRDPSLADVLLCEVAAARHDEATAGEDDGELLAHGVVTEGARAHLRRAALAQVIAPTASSLVARRAAA